MKETVELQYWVLREYEEKAGSFNESTISMAEVLFDAVQDLCVQALVPPSNGTALRTRFATQPVTASPAVLFAEREAPG